jgi:hypothetical protein
MVGDNGIEYEIVWRAGRAYLPMHLHNKVIREGVAVHSDEPAPPVQFERLGNIHGPSISPFASYLREIAR